MVWICDFSFLTRRYAYSNITKRKYALNPEPSKEWRGLWHKKGLKKNATFYPKWSRYAFRGLDEHEKLEQIPIYDKPIVLFCIMDLYSRYIVHAHLKQSPKDFVNQSFGFPSRWFGLDECFRESFRNVRPKLIYSDSDIYHSFNQKFKHEDMFWHSANDSNRVYLSPLEAFFFNVQFNFREDLTQDNLNNWINFYNSKRKMKKTRYEYLRNKTPLEIYQSSGYDFRIEIDESKLEYDMYVRTDGSNYVYGDKKHIIVNGDCLCMPIKYFDHKGLLEREHLSKYALRNKEICANCSSQIKPILSAQDV